MRTVHRYGHTFRQDGLSHEMRFERPNEDHDRYYTLVTYSSPLFTRHVSVYYGTTDTELLRLIGEDAEGLLDHFGKEMTPESHAEFEAHVSEWHRRLIGFHDDDDEYPEDLHLGDV